MIKKAKLIGILQSKRGELLLESILSLFILTLIISAAGAMIAISTSINKNSKAYSKEYYDEYSKVLNGIEIPTSDKNEMDIKITYYIDGKTNDSPIGKLPTTVTTLGEKLTITKRGIITID